MRAADFCTRYDGFQSALWFTARPETP
jgi:hypothetical protein